jgi:DNA-binding transcriptional regulator PaaX
MRLREIAAELGVTEQSAHVIVGRLAASGYLDKERDGCRNRYHVRRHLPLPELPDAAPAIGEVLRVLTHSGH